MTDPYRGVVELPELVGKAITGAVELLVRCAIAAKAPPPPVAAPPQPNWWGLAVVRDALLERGFKALRSWESFDRLAGGVTVEVTHRCGSVQAHELLGHEAIRSRDVVQLLRSFTAKFECHCVRPL